MTVEDDAGRDRLPVVVVGAGAMGRAWLRMLAASPHARLVGLVDLDVPLAEEAAQAEGHRGIAIGSDVQGVAARSGAAAVINVTVPGAHRAVNEIALRAGLPVLCEKPLAPSLSGALRQVALADVTGQLLVVSQSRRYFTALTAMRDARRGLGRLAAVAHEYFHADHEPGFREEMDHPLLVDMSIHHFDALRFVTEDEPVSVTCHSWNPPWSWYRGDAAAAAQFVLRSGAVYTYCGSRCTEGLQTSYNGAWRLYAERGAIAWDGDGAPEFDPAPVAGSRPAHGEQISGSLEDFVAALRSGRTPQNEVRSNILSLAMVEGAIASSAAGGRRVVLADLLEDAYARALTEETNEDVLARLRSWGSAAAGIASGHWNTEHLKERIA